MASADNKMAFEAAASAKRTWGEQATVIEHSQQM